MSGENNMELFDKLLKKIENSRYNYEYGKLIKQWTLVIGHGGHTSFITQVVAVKSVKNATDR